MEKKMAKLGLKRGGRHVINPQNRPWAELPQSFTRKNKKKVAFMILATLGEEESRVVRGDVASEDVGSSYWGEVEVDSG